MTTQDLDENLLVLGRQMANLLEPDGITVDPTEIAMAVRDCPLAPSEHLERTSECLVVELIHRRARELGVTWPKVELP